MMATSWYSNSLFEETVEVLEVNASYARCRTSYRAEVNVNWGSNLPSPVPQVGEIWRVKRVAGSIWAFDCKLNVGGYNLMRYSMSLDIKTCIGRERPVIDDIAKSGVTEIYLTVAEDGVVYWDSAIAGEFGLVSRSGSKGSSDFIRQVIDRCDAAGISVVLVIDCGLWSDATNLLHQYYRQKKISESYTFGTWMALLAYDWGTISYVTWRDILDNNWGGDALSSSGTWSFVTAKDAVCSLVSELYGKYGNRIRGICFSNWRGDGGFADVSDYVNGVYKSMFGRDIFYDMTVGIYSDLWWQHRSDMISMFDGLQRSFLADVKSVAAGMPVSVIIPSQVIFQSSERAGRFETWIDDDFGSYGWSLVGCPLDYVESADESSAMRSFEYGVACMNRVAKGSSPLFMLNIKGDMNYSGFLSILAKYDATNVMVGSYEDWRLLKDSDVLALSAAMNEYSVSPKSSLDDIGFYLSNDSRDVAHFDELRPNRFTDAVCDMVAVLLEKLPHRIRILYDSDVEDIGSATGLSSVVLFCADNMSDSGVEAVESLLKSKGVGVVVVGMSGRYPEWSTGQRFDMPFLGFFGERDFGTEFYKTSVLLRFGYLDTADNVFAFGSMAEGAKPTLRINVNDPNVVNAVGYDRSGNIVPVPLYFKGRSVMFSVDATVDDVLLDLASELVLYSIGRDA